MATLDFTKISVAAFLRKSNKGSAKRCLFGPVNHEENTRLLREQLASQEKESREKWNFDFRTETPVRGGRFNWEKVSDSSADDQENRVPAAYALPRMTASPLKSRLCSPLTFSSKVNRIQKPTCSVEKKRDLSFVAIDNKKDSLPKAVAVDINSSAKTELVICPAAERVSVTTVPVLKKFREETPTVQELSTKCTRVSDQITPESAENSHLEMAASTSSSSSSQESLTSSPSSRCSPSKRKLAQADITEFFPVKKSRNTMAVNSAKRRLDL